MTTKKETAIYLALASALLLGSAQMQAQTDDTSYVVDPEVQLETIEEAHEVMIDEHEAQLAVELEQREEQIVEEQAAQEAAMEQEIQEEAVLQEEEMDEEVARHNAEMAAYLTSRGISFPN